MNQVSKLLLISTFLLVNLYGADFRAFMTATDVERTQLLQHAHQEAQRQEQLAVAERERIVAEAQAYQEETDQVAAQMQAVVQSELAQLHAIALQQNAQIQAFVNKFDTEAYILKRNHEELGQIIARLQGHPNLTTEVEYTEMASYRRFCAQTRREVGLIQSIRPSETSEYVGLSVDGGGIRGIIPAVMLEHIEHQAGRSIRDLCDFFGGTSVGGVIALGVVSPNGLSASEMVGLFRDHKDRIFPQTGRRSLIGSIFAPKYSSDGLEELLLDKFGEAWLSEVTKPTIITALERNENTHYLFESTKANLEVNSYDFRLRDIARATGAPATYFPSAIIQNRIGGEFSFVDGGHWINNPAEKVYRKLKEHYGVNRDAVRIISLGTGHGSETPIPHEAGLVHVEEIINAGMAAHVHAANDAVIHAIGDRFHRFQPDLFFNIPLDGTSDALLDYLTSCAEEKFDELDELTRLLLVNLDRRNDTL